MPTIPISRGLGSGESESMAPLTAIKVLSVCQIAVGCASMVAQGIFTGIILLHMQPDMRHFLASFGIWGGLVFVLTGTLGIRLRKGHFVRSVDVSNPKRGHYRALASSFLAMNIVAAICAAVLFALNVVNLVWLSHRPLFYAPFYVMRHSEIYLYQPLTGTLLGLGVLELVLSSISASLCCSLRFHCCKTRESLYVGTRGRTRSFNDYPSAVMDSPGGSLARRVRSYSQSSLMSPTTGVVTGRPVSTTHITALPNYASGPPPSYDDAWEGMDMCRFAADAAMVAGSRDRREPRSNARLYQNLQSSRLSRTSF